MANDYFAGDGAACARTKSRYVPGLLIKADRFLPYSADIKNKLKLAKKVRGKAKTKLLKRIAALKKLNKKYSAICAAGPEGRTDTGDLTPTKSDQAVMDKIVSRFLKLEASAGTKEAVAKLVKELKKTTRVVKTVVSKDFSHITVVLDDGTEFGINTDDSFASQESPASSVMSSSVSAAVLDTAAIRASLIEKVASSAVCSSIVTPASRKALLVLAMSSVKNPIAMRAMNEIKAALLLLGWRDDDIDIRTRFETVNEKGEWVKDFSFTPDSILDMSGYGLVMFFGHGGPWVAEDGIEHSFIQGFASGTREQFAKYISDDRFLFFRQAYKKNQISVQYSKNETGEMDQVAWIRDDLLASALKVDAGASVIVTTCNSWLLNDTFSAVNPGSFAGWEGKVRGALTGKTAVIRMLDEMSGTSASKSDEEAYAVLQKAELNIDSGSGAQFRLSPITGDFYLPAWGSFFTSSDNLPTGTAMVQGKVSYPQCSAKDFDINLSVAESKEVEGLMPLDVSIDVKAFDSANKLLGTGLIEKTFRSGGYNETNLETCLSSVEFRADEYPQDESDPVATILGTLSYQETGYPDPQNVEFSPSSSESISGLWPGKANFAFSAKNSGGDTLGTYEKEVKIECGSNVVKACFGWVKFRIDEIPADSTKIRISAKNGDTITLSKGESGEIYGLAEGSSYDFTVEALDSHDVVQMTDTVSTKVECGENELPIALYAFGLILSTDKNSIAADGQDKALIKVTARKWLDSDVATPTGDPIPGKEISFGTTVGTLSAAKVTTDSNGEATVELSGTSSGLAVVTASIGVKYKQVEVKIGQSYQLQYISRQIYRKWDYNNKEYVCIDGYLYMLFDPQPGVKGYQITFHFNGYEVPSSVLSWYPRWKDDGKVVKLDIGDGIYSYSDAYSDDPNSSDMYVGTLLDAIGMRQDQFVYFAQNAVSLSCEYATNPNAEANLYSVYDQLAAAKWDLFLSAAKHWTVDVVPVY